MGTSRSREIRSRAWASDRAAHQYMCCVPWMDPGVITTAGFDRHSICYEVYEYAKGVEDGSIEDAERVLDRMKQFGD